MQGLLHYLRPQDANCLLQIALIGNADVKEFTNSAVCIVRVFNDALIDFPVWNDEPLVFRRTDCRMPQRDVFHRAGHANIDITHKITDDKRLERQDHNAAGDITQRIL